MVLNACTAVTLQLYVGIETTFVWLFYVFVGFCSAITLIFDLYSGTRKWNCCCRCPALLAV
jgi:hypothetical protein